MCASGEGASSGNQMEAVGFQVPDHDSSNGELTLLGTEQGVLKSPPCPGVQANRSLHHEPRPGLPTVVTSEDPIDIMESYFPHIDPDSTTGVATACDKDRGALDWVFNDDDGYNSD